MSFHRATISDFWREVEVSAVPLAGFSACWNFNGSNAYSGYRAFRSVLAHRAAATIYCGKVPARVHQRCGNRKCVNVAHLTISHEPVTKWKFNPLTGKPITPKRSNDTDLIKAVLDARPDTGRYSVTAIARQVGSNADTVRKILRESSLYDLAAEYAANGGKVQMEPNGVLA